MSRHTTSDKLAKKDIISDFSSLKGKISFSEKKPASSRHCPEAQLPSKPKEDILEPGQSVVLMDSDLRGKIVKIGKKVVIELEDGLMIEAASGEFAVTRRNELSSLKGTRISKTKVDMSVKSVGRSASPDNILSIDLHIEAIPGGRTVPKGHQLQFQMDTFRKVIRQNLKHKGMKITFIHGIGDGILKAAIRKELDEVLALRCSYSVGDPAVTTVIIK